MFQTAADPVATLGKSAVVSVWKKSGQADTLAAVTKAGLRAVLSSCWFVRRCVCTCALVAFLVDWIGDVHFFTLQVSCIDRLCFMDFKWVRICSCMRAGVRGCLCGW